MAHYEPPHQDLRCLQSQLFSSLVVKELIKELKTSAVEIIKTWNYFLHFTERSACMMNGDGCGGGMAGSWGTSWGKFFFPL